jgi:hypothetical protein
VKTCSYIALILWTLGLVSTCIAVEPARVLAGSKIFVEGDQGFDVFLSAALNKKNVPVSVVADKSQADFILEASSQSEKSGWARTIFLGQTGSNEEASIRLINVKTTEVVFAYAVNKRNSVHGKQSSAEACAKHLKDFVK